MAEHANSIVAPGLQLAPAEPTATPYQFDGHNFTIIEKDGEFWFVASEAARELGYRAALDLTRTLDDDEKGTHNLRTLGGPQEMSVISEPGLYRAIIQRRSNKKHDAALTERIARFQRWVFHDVLPSIRKTGGYNAAPAHAIPQTFPEALRLAADLADKVAEQRHAIESMAPKVAAHDRIAESFGSVCRRIAAKNLGVAPKILNRWLMTNKWTYLHANGDTLAYQSKIAAGYLEHKVDTGERSDGTTWTHTRVMVTPKGMLALAKAFPPALKLA